MISILLLLHVLFTTAGYVGLVAANVYLLMLLRGRQAQVIQAGLTAWRKASQIFGPLLATGVILGFGLTSPLHVPLAARWLKLTYALIIVVTAVHAAIMVPWQTRSNRMLATGLIPPTAPVATVLLLLCAGYTSIISLMLLRPN
jgi:hypothetical protein